MRLVSLLAEFLRAQFKGHDSVTETREPTTAQCVVSGRIATDPEEHYGKTTFVLAVPFLRKVEGTFTNTPTFCQVIVTGKMADHYMPHLTMGRVVTITGTVVTTYREVVRHCWFGRTRRLSTSTTDLLAHTVEFV